MFSFLIVMLSADFLVAEPQVAIASRFDHLRFLGKSWQTRPDMNSPNQPRQFRSLESPDDVESQMDAILDELIRDTERNIQYLRKRGWNDLLEQETKSLHKIATT